jgi:RecB family exonuclease
MTPSILVEQLNRLRETYPRAPLVVFVPRTQLGRALETALARHRGGWEGVRILIPRHYAESVAQIDSLQSGRREAPVEAHLFRTARILQERPQRETDGLPGWHLLASTVASAIDTLREGDVPVDSVRQRAEVPEASDTLGIVADCYDRYVQELEARDLYDDATVYQWATERVQASKASEVQNTVYAVVGAASLSEHATQFLEALQQNAKDFVRLGIDGSGHAARAPSETAAARFGNVDVVPASAQEDEAQAADDRFVRAVGATNEVKAVLRDLLENDIAFDDATIAYASAQPYPSLIADEAERAGIPITLGTGLLAEQTRTGRALRGLYEWVREDYDPAILIRMLREELLRTDRWLDGDEDDTGEGDLPSLRPHDAATLLAGRSYESGRDGLLGGLQSAMSSLRQKAEDRADETLTDREEDRLERLRLLAGYVEALVDLVPWQGDVRALAENSYKFLQTFGPLDPVEDVPEEERTLDEAARQLLYDRLSRLSEMQVSCEASDRQLAALMMRWLDEQAVQAQRPRPGHVHVLPLESAGYSDRSHLSVVGLDGTTFAAPMVDNGMLQDADRRALVDSLKTVAEETEARPTTPADDALWRAACALERHRGPTAYYTRIFDVEAGEERDPSSLFLQKESETLAQQPGPKEELSRTVGLVPAADDIALADRDRWLTAYRRGRQQPEGIPETAMSARDLLQTEHSWIVDGEAARQARQSDRYTVHDGLLPAGEYPELDFFGEDGRPVSASRLETLAEAPYVYFLKYVLGVRALDEPAIDDDPWFNPLRKGTLLHAIYEQFMKDLKGEPPTAEDLGDLMDIVEEKLEKEVEESAAPSEVVKQSARRELRRNAKLFLRAEMEHGADYAPDGFEWGFGFPPHRRKDQDEEAPARLTVNNRTIRLRGRIDRVDRNRESSDLVAWDYKTGGTSSYDENDPLQDGKTLQWALYAYALEALRGETVEASGYFFATAAEVGRRMSASPAAHRAAVNRLLSRLGALAESGTFPVAPHLPDVTDWKWNGYDRIVHDLRERRRELQAKAYPEDRPEPPSF